MNRLNKGQTFVLRELRSEGTPKCISTSDCFNTLKDLAILCSKTDKSKNIYGFKVCERPGKGRNSEETVYSVFK